MPAVLVGRQEVPDPPSRAVQVLREEDAAVRIYISMGDNSGYQFKTHPKLDKSLYSQDSILGLKDPTAAFPAGSPLGVLKWRYQVGSGPVSNFHVAAGSGCALALKDRAQRRSQVRPSLQAAVAVLSALAPRLEAAFAAVAVAADSGCNWAGRPHSFRLYRRALGRSVWQFLMGPGPNAAATAAAAFRQQFAQS